MQAKIAAKEPSEQKLAAGTKYYWCSCGHSQKQPFCDGSHNTVNKSLPAGSTPYKPLGFSVQEEATKWLCQCKQTKNPPYCDGTHKSL